jgi:hypothetical protein
MRRIPVKFPQRWEAVMKFATTLSGVFVAAAALACWCGVASAEPRLNAPGSFQADTTAITTTSIKWKWTDTNSNPNETGVRVRRINLQD